MSYRRIVIITKAVPLLIALLVSVSSCNYTRHLKKDERLLWSNNIKLKSDQNITSKGEIKDNLASVVVQEPNSDFLGIRFKLWLYNTRYDRYQADTNNFQLKSRTVEKPVIYDSSTKRRSVLNMNNYLFSQGYFYSKVYDTTTYDDKKATVTYRVETGPNYLIHDTYYDINDSTVNAIVQSVWRSTVFRPGLEFSFPLLEEERTRLVTLLRDYGYYKINNTNINFELDTLNKEFAKDKDNPIEEAINFIALQKNTKRPTLNIKTIIRADEDPTAYTRYAISRVRVFPDYTGGRDFRDSSMIQKVVGKYTIRYHNYYIRENVLLRHIFLEPDKYYSQKLYDLTVSKLNEIGTFQSIRISFSEDTARRGWLNANVFLTPSEKFDFSTNLEVSTGNAYQAGSAAGLVLRDRNFTKGGNMLTLALTGGIEMTHDTIGKNFFDRFHMLTRSGGINAVIDFPKFLLPFTIRGMSKKNIPRSQVQAGINVLDRVKYFRSINSSMNLKYKWRETSTKNWELSPAFVNLIKMPYISDSFQHILDSNSYLANTYKETLIEGENISFIFSDREKRPGKDYTFVKISGEEAGALVKGVKGLYSTFGSSYEPKLDSSYSQYVKFDLDAQHFFLGQHSSFACRFLAGVGLPYDKSLTLPYLKQYYVGGAYSLRGFRIRTLGPGSYIDTAQDGNNVIDRTGDIKLELNGEYRFDIVDIFSGTLKLKGALFADAGNIWLSNPSPEYPSGEFAFNKLAKDVAVSTGAGLRLDIAGFFLLRFDVGFPVKLPDYYLKADEKGIPISNGWVVDELFSTSDWGSKNLVYNIAIGYPF